MESTARMDHVVSYVVDLALRTYRACVRGSVAAEHLSVLLRGLGYTVQKGDLAGIPWKALPCYTLSPWPGVAGL